jgi:hypothetical protein
MTRQEAKQKLQQDHKITHEYFTDGEYIHLQNGVEHFEDGIPVPKEWWDLNEFTEDGWRIFKTKDSVTVE